MRSNENFEEIVKKDLDVRASDRTYDRLRDIVLDAHGRSQTNPSAATPTITRRTFMRNPLTKLAAAAAIVLAVMLGMYLMTGSVDGASITMAQVRQALQNIDWMQMTNKIGKEVAWLSFASKVEIVVDSTGKIVYSDFNTGKKLTWNPGSKDIYESPIDQRRPFAGGTSGPFEFVSLMFSFFRDENGWKITKELGTYEGRKVEVWTASRAAENSGATKTCTVYIDVEKKLPVASVDAIKGAEGTIRTQAQVEWKCPETGPADIYAAGAPKSAPIKPAPEPERSGEQVSPQEAPQ